MAPYVRYAEQDDPGMYLVHHDTRSRVTCDVFVLHGLHGGATKTFRHPATGNIWFRDLLPDEIRNTGQGANARIWTYGYPANIAFTTNSIDDYAQSLLNRVKDVRKGFEGSKIVWICHSLGGLILKRALIDAQLHARFQTIRTDTAGIIFLGTPHQGSGVANLGHIVASVVSSAMPPGFRKILNNDIIRDLRRNNNTLFGMSAQFSNICSGIVIHSFHETIPLSSGMDVIVDKTSAIMCLENEEKRFGLNSNHRDMCKFRDALDQNWIPLASSVTELVALTAPGSQGPGAPNIRRQTTTQRSRMSNTGSGYNSSTYMGARNTSARSQFFTNNTSLPTQVPPVPAKPWYYQPQEDNPTVSQPGRGQNSGNWETSNIPFSQNFQQPTEVPRSAYFSSESSARSSPAPSQRSDRPTFAPPQLPSGWVSQWDPETAKYFFVELDTGTVQWDPPSVTRGTATSPGSDSQQRDRLNVPPTNHQRSRSDTSPADRPAYPSLNPAHSRTDLRSASYQQAQTSKNTRPPPASSISLGSYPDVHEEEDDEASKREAAQCDSCGGSIRCSQPRVQCTVCYDYDLCIKCFQADKISKNHNNKHKMSHILNTDQLSPEDLIPVKEAVNPERNAAGTRTNWSIREIASEEENGKTQCYRMIHLFENDSHSRFLTSAKPGHYGVSMIFAVELSASLSEESKQYLRDNGSGWIRVALGTVKNKKDFFGTNFMAEDSFSSNTMTKDCLPHKLLGHYWWHVEPIDLDSPLIHIYADGMLTIEGEPGSLVDIGFILQWSAAPYFQNTDDPVISLMLDHIRMDNLLDYNEPYVRAPRPAAPKPTPPPQAGGSASQPSNTSAAAEEADDSEPTAEEFMEALLQLQREYQDAAERAVLEAMLRERLQQQEKAKQEAVERLILQAYREYAQEQEQKRRQQEEFQQYVALVQTLQAMQALGLK